MKCITEAELLKKAKVLTYRRSSSKARMKSSDKVFNTVNGLLAPPKRLGSRQRFSSFLISRGRNAGSSVQQVSSIVRKKSSVDKNLANLRSGSSKGNAGLNVSKFGAIPKSKPPLPRKKA